MGVYAGVLNMVNLNHSAPMTLGRWSGARTAVAKEETPGLSLLSNHHTNGRGPAHDAEGHQTRQLDVDWELQLACGLGVSRKKQKT